jgi:uncharacterized protein YhfF
MQQQSLQCTRFFMNRDSRQLLEAHFPGEEDRYFPSFSIGNSPSAADAGALAILSGVKTTTSSPFWDFPDGRIPFVSALSILLDGQGNARAIIETERIEIKPFGSVDKAFLEAYGEGDGTLGWWHSEIRDWYSKSADRHGCRFTDNTEIICEWIKVARRLQEHWRICRGIKCGSSWAS